MTPAVLLFRDLWLAPVGVKAPLPCALNPHECPTRHMHKVALKDGCPGQVPGVSKATLERPQAPTSRYSAGPPEPWAPQGCGCTLCTLEAPPELMMTVLVRAPSSFLGALAQRGGHHARRVRTAEAPSTLCVAARASRRRRPGLASGVRRASPW